MKKLILSLSLFIIGFIGFSNAFKVDLQLNCNQSTCWADKNYRYTYYISNDLPVGEYKIINSSVPFSSYTYTVNYAYGGNDSGVGNPLQTTKKFNYLPPVAHPYIEFHFNFDRDLDYGEKVDFSLVSSDYRPPLLPGGVGALSGAVNNLRNSVNEFIPIISYVGIGIISALLGFFAIRYLINWVRNNTLSVFKSRKRK